MDSSFLSRGGASGRPVRYRGLVKKSSFSGAAGTALPTGKATPLKGKPHKVQPPLPPLVRNSNPPTPPCQGSIPTEEGGIASRCVSRQWLMQTLVPHSRLTPDKGGLFLSSVPLKRAWFFTLRSQPYTPNQGIKAFSTGAIPRPCRIRKNLTKTGALVSMKSLTHEAA